MKKPKALDPLCSMPFHELYLIDMGDLWKWEWYKCHKCKKPRPYLPKVKNAS